MIFATGSLSVEFDPHLFDKLSPYQLQNKKDRLGFYRTDKNVYVLTTVNSYSKIKLVTDIKKIAKLLERASISSNDLETLPIQHSIKNLQYLDCIHKVIAKHNLALALKRTKLHFLFQIPIIKTLIAYFFQDLKNLDHLAKEYLQKVHDKIQPSFKNFTDAAQLVQHQNELMDFFNKVEQAQSSLTGKGIGEIWKQEKAFVEKLYHEKLITIIPALKFAHQVIQNDQFVKTQFNVQTIEQATQNVKKLMKECTLDVGLQSLVPEPLKTITKKAQSNIFLTYCEWRANHVISLVENDDFLTSYDLLNCPPPERTTLRQNIDKPLISQLLDTQDINQFTLSYENLKKQLMLLKVDSGKRAIDDLDKAYHGYVKTLILFLPHFQNFKTVSLEEAIAYYKQGLDFLKSWKTLKPAAEYEQVFKTSINKFSEQLDKNYQDRVTELVPIYGQATGILAELNKFKEGTLVSNDPRLLVEQMHPTEQWYQTQRTQFSQDLAIQLRDLPPEISQFILEVNEKLLANYVQLEKRQLDERLKESKVSIFEQGINYLLPWNFFWGSKKLEDTLINIYALRLLKMLGIQDKNELEAKYQNKIDHLRTLPNTSELIVRYKEAYSNYERAAKIHWLISQIKNPTSKLNEGYLDTEEGQFKLSHSNELNLLIEQEIKIQQKNNDDQELIKKLYEFKKLPSMT